MRDTEDLVFEFMLGKLSGCVAKLLMKFGLTEVYELKSGQNCLRRRENELFRMI